jgi:hypothetical protein
VTKVQDVDEDPGCFAWTLVEDGTFGVDDDAATAPDGAAVFKLRVKTWLSIELALARTSSW